MRSLREQTFDLFLLDMELPGVQGKEVLRWIRNTVGAHVPVMALTAYKDDYDLVAVLAAGADDYLSKPIRIAELVARVQALLRRSRGSHEGFDGVIRQGAYVFDVTKRVAHCAGEVIQLTRIEFDIAIYLFRNMDRLVPRELLERSVWGRSIGQDSRTLDTHISRIRTKLKLVPRNGVRLVSIYSHGFRMVSVKSDDEVNVL